MKLNLLVIRSRHLHELKEQYELLGFEFAYHQHGNGPFHYASESLGFVFEIYPLTKNAENLDNTMRFGFEVAEDISQLGNRLEQAGWNILSYPRETEWGRGMVVQDIDGRKIELKNKPQN